MNSDSTLGYVFLVLSIVIYLYYSIWVLATPFVTSGHVIHSFFPDRELAITIPIVLLVVGLTLIGSFLAIVMIKSKSKKPTKDIDKDQKKDK